MKVAVNTTTKTIVDLLPDSATSNHKFLVHNGYKLLDVENPMIDGNFRDLTDAELLPILVEDFKRNREVLVNNIEVTYNNVIYQGDEKAQDRINRAINGLPNDTTTIPWKAKDNNPYELTRIDLKKILYLAIQKQTQLWFENEPT